MIRIGIVGSDNSHADAIAALCNTKDHLGRRIPGMKVTHLFGLEKKRTEEVATNGKIAHIVSDPCEMIGQIDLATFVFRHGGLHLKYAEPFLKAGVPCFVDKPFAARVADARKMVRLAKRYGTPLTSYSSLRCCKGTVQFKKDLKAIGDLPLLVVSCPGQRGGAHKQYGGLIFYGIHGAEMVLEVMGADVKSVVAKTNGNNIVATITMGGGRMAVLQFLGGAAYAFHYLAHGTDGMLTCKPDSSDSYVASMKRLKKFCKTGQGPVAHEQMIKAVQLINAVDASLDTGKEVKLSSVK